MANATCQFTQGVIVGGSGQSVIGFSANTLVTMTDAGGNTPSTTWQWAIISWPGPLSAPPSITNATQQVATVTPTLDGVYIVQLTRVQSSVTTIDVKFFGVLDADGLILPSAGQTGAMTNVSSPQTLAQNAGWMGRVNAGTNIFLDAYLRWLKSHIRGGTAPPTPLLADVGKVIAVTGAGAYGLTVAFTPAGDLSGTVTSQTVVGIRGATAPPTPLLADVGKVISVTGAGAYGLAVAFTPAGDLSGSVSSQTVIGLQGRSVRNQAPTDGQQLTWVQSNSDWEPITPGPRRIYGIGATSATTQSSPQTFCYFGFDPSVYPSNHRTITFYAVLQCASTTDTATLTLIDFTDATTISTLTHTGDTLPAEVSITLTVGAVGPNQIPNSRKLYYMTLQRTGGAVSDAVTVHTAYLEVSY